MINTQAVQIETLTGQIEACRRMARVADRGVGAAAGFGLVDLLEAALVGPALPQAGTSLVAHRLGPQAR